jgi:LacI family transcriptional regulator, repressor for deo operon, udp, cdd, tsx, nupC, and nupG
VTALALSEDEPAVVAAACELVAVRYFGSDAPDASVIAFHDGKVAQYLTPSLSTIWMPLFELGEAATRQLVDMINGRSTAQFRRLQDPEPRVIERASTAPHRDRQPARV